jgi:hypothetical protein
MSAIYRFAPKAVIDSLTSSSRNIVERRIIDNELKSYVPLGYHIRIRGLKPSILYTKYTSLTETNIIESMYTVTAEEDQCTWVKKIQKKSTSFPQVDLFINAMTEMPWCEWEDKFMSNNVTIPQSHLHGHVDIANNTFFHCIAYACANKQPIDLDQIEAQFQAANFTINPDLFLINDLGETPLKILMHNEELLVFVESILLRLPPEKRLNALNFAMWSKSWGSLLQTMVTQEIHVLIQQTSNMEGFLSIFFHLTHNNEDALLTLFVNNYKLKPWHIYRDKLKPQQKQMLKQAMIRSPSWHNFTMWLYLIREHNAPDIQFIKMRNFLNHRASIIKELLLIKTMNPEYAYLNMDTMME